MLLTKIQHYLQQQKRANLLQLSQLFKIDRAILQDMLALLIRKGYVKACMKTPRCGAQCTQCSALVTEVYEWIK